MTGRIAILGWGSLLWDIRPDFDDYHEDWKPDGPALPIEFSRVSKSRGGALTLVIDADNGACCAVAYAISKRRNLADAICDLRTREGTTHKNIGYWAGGDHVNTSIDTTVVQTIGAWAVAKNFEAVVWTALSSNFEQICGMQFSVEAAIKHIQALHPEAKTAAAEYVWRAPKLVETPLRRALEVEPWFKG